MHKWLFILPVLLLASCSQYGKVSFAQSPQVINVSEYDPKEKQRSGSSFTPFNQKALKDNGSLGLIARTGKGTHIDTKCAEFLVGAHKQNMKLGTYFYVLPNISSSAQAHRYINRLKQIKAKYPFLDEKVLLVADFDTKCSTYQMTTFLKEVKKLTGVKPVVYLENGDAIRNTLKYASSKDKSFLRSHPYWLALYSTNHPKYKTPEQLVKATGVWNTWAMWQYAGVWWENGRSKPHYYRGGNWQTPAYFGNLSQPSERNGFNGSEAELYAFWSKHSWAW